MMKFTLVALVACALTMNGVAGQGLLGDCSGTCDDGLQCCQLTENTAKCFTFDQSCDQYAAQYASDNSGGSQGQDNDPPQDPPQQTPQDDQNQQTDPNQQQQTDPNQQQTDPNQQQQTDPNQQQTDPNQQQTDPNQQQTDPNQQQTDPNQQQTDPNQQQQTDPNQQQQTDQTDQGKGSTGDNTVPIGANDLATLIVDNAAASGSEITCSTPRDDGDGTDPDQDLCPEDLECCTFNAFYHSCQEECLQGNATATLYKRCFSYTLDSIGNEIGIDLNPDICEGNTTCQYVNAWYAQCLLDETLPVTSQSV